MGNSQTKTKASDGRTDSTQAVPTLVTYRVKRGKEADFVALLAKHWPTLDKLGLVTKDKPLYWRAVNKREQDKISFIELFAWRNAAAAEVAHETPQVMAIWEPMGPILEGLELQSVEPLDLGH